MTFKRSIPKCTPEQQARQDQIRQGGCIACQQLGGRFCCGNSEIHHLTVSGRTISQDHTICLGSWHHRRIPIDGWTFEKMTEVFGPSLMDGSKVFHQKFGSNERLLSMQNELVI